MSNAALLDKIGLAKASNFERIYSAVTLSASLTGAVSSLLSIFGALYGTLLLGCGLLGALVTSLRGQRVPPGTNPFAGTQRFTLGQQRSPADGSDFTAFYYKRAPDADNVANLLQTSPPTTCILVGDSGAGKSSFVAIDLCEALKRKDYDPPNDWIVDTYTPEDLPERLRRIPVARLPTEASSSDIAPILVFDQFDAFLRMPAQDREHVASLLKRVCSSGNFSIPLVVRSEYLNDCLRQLEQWNAPAPKRYDLLGLRVDENEISEQLHTKLFLATRTRKIRSAVLRLFENVDSSQIRWLPIEIQIIGLMAEFQYIERESPRRAQVRMETFDDRQSIIHAFVTRILEYSPSRNVTDRVLFAFATANLHKVAMTNDSLAWVTHLDKARVEECTAYLRKISLVTGDSILEIFHDYLAKIVRDYAAINLGSTARDNIFVFVESLASMDRESSDAKTFSFRQTWYGASLIVLSACCFLGALIAYTSLPERAGLGFMSESYASGLLRSWNNSILQYTPTLAPALLETRMSWTALGLSAGLVWAVYAGMLHATFFAQAPREFRMDWLPFLCFASPILGLIVPQGWLFIIAWGGICVMVAFWKAGCRCKKASTSRLFLWRSSIMSLVLFAAHVGLGVLFILFMATCHTDVAGASFTYTYLVGLSLLVTAIWFGLGFADHIGFPWLRRPFGLKSADLTGVYERGIG